MSSTSSPADRPLPPPLLLPCRCCYHPTPVSQLLPYRYLAAHAFESKLGHARCLCPTCDDWMHPGAGRTDLWEQSEGKDKFCRLCGDGDRSIEAYVCEEDGCPFTFCALCIRANGGERLLREVRGGGRWVCFNHKVRPSGCAARLLDAVDLLCRAERGQFTHRNVYDCFNVITHAPIPSFTYLTPKAKQRWQPHLQSHQPHQQPKRLVSTCLYKWTSSAPKHHVKYLYGLMENMQHFPARWPGWTLRLYYDNSLILPAAAPEDELDHVHSHSDDELPAHAVDSSAYTRSLADTFRVLLSTFANHPSIELVWYNFPYLQDRSHHHHGHIGMAARFLALADLGVTATHVVVADLDNLWHETARLQAERFEAGKRYHRYNDIDYVFPLAGGSFNARVDRIQPDKSDASPFVDIESQLHAFFTAHYRAPEEMRDKYGEQVDESESIAPNQSTAKRGRTDGELHASDDSDQPHRRKSRRVALRAAQRDVLPVDEESSSSSGGSDSEETEQEEVQDSSDEKEVEVDSSGQVSDRRVSKRISAALERRKQADRKAKQAEAARARQAKKQRRNELKAAKTCLSSSDFDSSKERRDLHHYFFGYSCDQVFLQERVWPVVSLSCATTVIQLDHIKPDKRERNKQDEAEVAELDADPLLSRCDKAEHERRQVIRCRARDRSRWQGQRQKRLFKHYFGMVDERFFPQHNDIRDWLSKRVREVWSSWRQHASSASIGSSGSRRSSSWQPRADPPATLDIHSLITAPGHFQAHDGAAIAQYSPQFALSSAAAFIGLPSATSPIDCHERWESTSAARQRHTTRGQAGPSSQAAQPPAARPTAVLLPR